MTTSNKAGLSLVLYFGCQIANIDPKCLHQKKEMDVGLKTVQKLKVLGNPA